MSNAVVQNIRSRAVAARKRVLLPESSDDRVLSAARKITELNYAHVTLLGDADEVSAAAGRCGVNLDGVEIVNPQTDEHREKYVEQLHEKRKDKGMGRDDAQKLLGKNVYYGAMMLGDTRADGMVAGSVCTTADTVRSALYGVGLAEGNRTVSSCSVVNTIMPDIGVGGALIFADTGVVPEPNYKQLADIGIAAADACRSLLNAEPCVAMLSFSTKSSAHSPAVQKVIEATQRIQRRRADIIVDGELQLDAALVPAVAERKASGSPIAGRANTLIFPDLSCGNIGYKLVERLGGATALGPLLLGLAKPVNDLSRGCSVEDLVLVAAITAVQCS